MRRIPWIAGLAIASLLLAACSGGGGITVTIPDRVDLVREANTTDGVALAEESTIATNLSMPPGQDRVLEVDVPASDYAALFVYIDAELPISVYRADGSLYATSRTSAFFGTGREGLAPLALDGGATSRIVAQATCPGSCVIAPVSGSGTFYLEIDNTSGVTQTVNVWATLRDFGDENEAYSEDDPMPVPLTETTAGAIESLGDTDYFFVEDDGYLSLGYVGDDTGIDLVAEVHPFGGGPVERLEPGEEIFVAFSDEVHVFAENPRAAVSGESRYTLYLSPDPTF